MTRKLVTHREISDVFVHPNADALELARVDGWQVVVRGGEFVRGDMCAFFEIDSWLPADDERFSFLAKSGTKKDPSGKERIRLKTIKLRGQLSQGLALPWTLFPELHGLPDLSIDLSEHLDIIKFERPEPQVTNAAGHFPECIPKTDEERIQNLWDVFKTIHRDTEFVPTLKLDGSSCTVAYFGLNYDDHWKNEDSYDDFLENTGTKIGEVAVCSRNLQLKYDTNSHFWKAAEAGNVIHAVSELGRIGNFAIQGEVLGPGIQGNKEKLTGFDFYAFALYDIDYRRYVDWSEAKDMLENLGVKCVPELTRPTRVFKHFHSLDNLLAFSDGPSINAKHREGIVWKSVGTKPQVSSKAISNKFLLSGGDD